MKVVVIIPTYNEVKNIKDCIETLEGVFVRIKNHSMPILVADDSSPDGTFDVVKKLMKRSGSNVHLVIKKKKEGLGAAYTNAMDYAFHKMNADAVITFDADLSHDPEIIPDFVRLMAGGAKFVCGTRYKKGGSIPDEWGLHRKFLSYVGNLFIRVLYFGSGFSDFTSGYKAITKEVYEKIKDKIKVHTGYTFAISANLEPLRAGYKAIEIPYKFRERTEGASKMGAEYFVKALIFVLQCRVTDIMSSRFAKVFIAGGIGALAQFISYGFIFYPIIEVRNLLNLSVQSQFLSFTTHPRFLYSQLLSIEIGLITAFLVNNVWAFSDKKLSGLPLIRAFFKNHLVVTGAIVIQIVIAQLLGAFFGISLILGYVYQIIGILAGLFWNFYFYKKIIWKVTK